MRMIWTDFDLEVDPITDIIGECRCSLHFRSEQDESPEDQAPNGIPDCCGNWGPSCNSSRRICSCGHWVCHARSFKILIENSLIIHCVHCPDYDPDNMYDLVAPAFTHRPFYSHEPGHGADVSPADPEDTELAIQHQDECIAALKPIRTDELRTSKSSDPCSVSLQVLFGSLIGAMAYSLLTQMIYEQFMRIQPSQRQSLVKV